MTATSRPGSRLAKIEFRPRPGAVRRPWPRRMNHCRFVARVMALKREYAPTVDTREARALRVGRGRGAGARPVVGAPRRGGYHSAPPAE